MNIMKKNAGRSLTTLVILISLIFIPKIAFAGADNLTLAQNIKIPQKIKIISRQQWGADEKITLEKIPEEKTDEEQSKIEEADPEIKKIVEMDASAGQKYIWPLQYAKEIKFIVIHYTAVTKDLDNPMQNVRNIFHSHTVQRGWGDIGYHYLIDPEGNIYEGRKGGEFVIGGHAKPVNKVSIGIALMGNYNDEELPPKMLASLIALVNQQTKLYKIDPLGKTEYKEKTYFNIHGHEDNQAKLDPGKYGRQKLAFLREFTSYVQGKRSKDFEQIEGQKMISLPPDSEKSFTLKLKNKSKFNWGKNTYLENTSDKSLPKVFAKLENEKVPIGGLGTFKGEIKSNLISGLRMPSLRLAIAGAIKPKASFPLPIMTEGLKTTYEIVGRNDPKKTLAAGKKAKAWIMLKNTGNFTWRNYGKNPVRIGTTKPIDRASELFKGKNRIGQLVEHEVKPGEIGKFVFNLKTPKYGGVFSENFAPVVENITWMKDIGMNFTVTVESKEKPLRVALSFSGKKPKIKSAAGMKLYEGTKLLHEFAKNEIVTTALLKNGKYRVRTDTKKITLNSPPRFSALKNGILEIVNFENKPAWNPSLNDNLFRGILEVQKVGEKLTVINELPLEDYLKGIAEISNSDPKEKIKTIIILARSYAKYYRNIGKKFPGKPYDLDDNPDHTQKYVGYGLELRSPNISAAVKETTRQIVTYNGKQVLLPYFNQSDGRTRSAEEVWGWKDAPYLQSVKDEFCGSTELKGHGVGLSGCGATKLAEQGWNAEKIIKYYYKGVEITEEK
ncbi:SpoIID/LytB domain-containing protein [Candidatus Peregrinibacteria bacterium]|nr:SpoIID/LytB domain-containing protein [Candidatus Peregrinibacteria bacterium]